MAYFTFQQARDAFSRQQAARPFAKTASQVLNEAAKVAADTDTFDIFLSHCIKDAKLVAGVKALLEEQGRTVYVDWVVDSQLDRRKVSGKTAALLRKRMRACESMIFATSENSPASKWMPWE